MSALHLKLSKSGVVQFGIDPRALRYLSFEQPDDHSREKDIDQSESDERNFETRHRGDGLGRAHNSLNDPGLASDLGHRPSGFNRDEAKRRRGHNRA